MFIQLSVYPAHVFWKIVSSELMASRDVWARALELTMEDGFSIQDDGSDELLSPSVR